MIRLIILALAATANIVDSLGQFATITSYTNAREFLEELKPRQRPVVFDELTLEEKHAQLRAEGCEPRKLFLVGRHAARHPDAGEIAQLNADLRDLVRLVRAKSGWLNAHNRALMDPRYQVENFDLASENLLTREGIREERQLAQRLKRIYPEFFDATRAQIHLGTTSKLRTAQTATEFAAAAGATDELELGCPRTMDHMARYRCVMKLHAQIELEYHKVCKAQLKAGGKLKAAGGHLVPQLSVAAVAAAQISDADATLARIAQLKQQLLGKLQTHVSDKLALSGLDGDMPQITVQHVESLYNACRYQLSAGIASRWCALFEPGHLSALDYLEDASIYHKIASRLESNKLQACPIVRQIVNTLTSSAEQHLEAHFGFTHVGVLKKLLAVFGFFDSPAGYTLASLERMDSAQQRQWRTSLMVPFSGNIQFVLYQCVAAHESRILAAVTERPVRLAGCSDSACRASEFQAAYGHLSQCDPSRVCDEVAKSLQSGAGDKDE